MSFFKNIISDLIVFTIKQASACVFGGFLLFMMIITKYWYPLEGLHRYDFLFLAAIAFQGFLFLFKLETAKEAFVIIIFHIVATGMEVFKTSDSIQSWTYPESFYFGIYNVPLFAGFMYSAVGSYIARIWRLHEFQFSFYPNKLMTYFLVAFIYINFFTHHYIWDFRWVLLAITILYFYKSDIYYKLSKNYRKMPLLLGFFLVTFFIWIAENLATYTNIWLYPNQKNQWELVPIAKISSWYLLMLLSFVLVSAVKQIQIYPRNK